ncbi:ABC transporter permease [Microvirga antarctica]|uniref:ABC transporter permease n=1 Tax=Microvirga antarctica TaxID=2819233 RepID=UPI001B300A5E|nr:iron ABC transporter permease [Microvirga antarctica]
MKEAQRAQGQERDRGDAPAPTLRPFVNLRAFRGGWFNVISGTIGTVFAAIVVYLVVRLALRLFFNDGHFDTDVFARVLAYRDLSTILLNTVVIVTSSMILALVIGSLFAWLMERTDARIDWLAGLLPMFSMILLPIAGAIGWVFLLAPQAGFINGMLRAALGWFGIAVASGPLNIYSWPGIILLYTAYMIPFAFLMVSTGLRNSDPSMEEAARISGASLFQTLWQITIPVLRPSLGAAALYIIWFGFSFFSVPVVIGNELRVRVLAVEIVRLVTFTYPSDVAVAIGLSVFLVIALGTAWYFQGRILRANRHASIGGKGQRTATLRLGKLRVWGQTLLIVYAVLTFVLPLLALILVALNGYWTIDISWGELNVANLWMGATENRAASRSLVNSFSLAVIGATIAMLVAAIFSLYLRHAHSRWALTLDGIIKLPSALSAIVIGLGFVLAFAGPPFQLGNTYAILLLCYVVLFLPQATISADAAAAQVDKQLSEASWVSGARGGMTFLRISLPLMVPGLIAGWGLLFVWMTGELNASIMVSGTRVPVIGFQILQIFQTGGFAVLASLALILTAINVVVLSAAHVFERRIGRGSSGRNAALFRA